MDSDFIWEYGWNCGVQHFVFVLLVLNFTVSAGTMGMKIGAAALACAYRIFCMPIRTGMIR